VVRLRASDREARIAADGYSGTGYVLSIDGIEQSHVDLFDPLTLRHEYLARMAAVIAACADMDGDAEAPPTVLHLGAGALTLARWFQSSFPGAEQVAVDVERELMTFVIDTLPLPEGTLLDTVVADARAVLEVAADQGRRFDVVVLDVFSGQETPAHLAGEPVYALCLQLLAPDGVLLVNIGDDAGLRCFGAQARALEQASADAGLDGCWTLTSAAVAEDLTEGNLVLAAGPGLDRAAKNRTQDLQDRLLAAGPHPAEVLDPYATAGLTARTLDA
jgi:hypothetical protein